MELTIHTEKKRNSSGQKNLDVALKPLSSEGERDISENILHAQKLKKRLSRSTI